MGGGAPPATSLEETLEATHRGERFCRWRYLWHSGSAQRGAVVLRSMSDSRAVDLLLAMVTFDVKWSVGDVEMNVFSRSPMA